MGENRTTLRAAEPGDCEALHELIAELALDTGLLRKYRGSPAAYREYGFGERPLFEALLALRAKKVVGAALYFRTFSSWRGEPGVYVQDLVVQPTLRGQGIGYRLLAKTAQIARDSGASHLRLAVDRDNVAAMRFYKRCGMSAVDDDRIFQISGEAFAELGDSA